MVGPKHDLLHQAPPPTTSNPEETGIQGTLHNDQGTFMNWNEILKEGPETSSLPRPVDYLRQSAFGIAHMMDNEMPILRGSLPSAYHKAMSQSLQYLATQIIERQWENWSK